MKSLSHEQIIETVSAMEQLACDLYQRFQLSKQEGLYLDLKGELGAGKTVFVRGFLRAMGYQGVVKSPTYTLVESYEMLPKVVHHFDLYRLNHPHELENIGIRDYFEKDIICFVEWPEKAGSILPTPDVGIDIICLEDKRVVKITAHSDRGRDVLGTAL